MSFHKYFVFFALFLFAEVVSAQAAIIIDARELPYSI